MSNKCEVVEVEAAPTAVLRATTTHADLHLTIGRLLDPVWEFLRSDTVQPPLVPHHNIVLYHGSGTRPEFEVEVGVRVDRPFPDEDASGVQCSALPAGRAARVVHTGPYNRMRDSYAVLTAWIEAQGLRGTGTSWEIYGDHREDPEELETELFIQVDG